VSGQPRLLDLFSGAGGAARGYQRAGFHVTGIDHRPQPRYAGDVFVQADALEYLAAHGGEFDAIHGSPPCQRHSAYRRCRPGKLDTDYPNLIPATRDALAKLGRPYVIENVEGAPLGLSLVLCGSMFGLMVRRHRVFETSWLCLAPGPCRHRSWRERLYPGGRSRERGGPRMPCRATVEVGRWNISLDVQQQAMGIDWMTVAELSQAVPPVYTHLIGSQLMNAIGGIL
jgi:hypothetical protein